MQKIKPLIQPKKIKTLTQRQAEAKQQNHDKPKDKEKVQPK